MRDALIEAKVGLTAVREAIAATRAQLDAGRQELATIQRRGRMAAEINDQETVRIAAQFEARQSERVSVLERKLAAQESELELAEREVAEMTAQLKTAQAAGGMASAAPRAEPVDAPPADDDLRRTVDRMARESQAERQLNELKRRMGK